jgi:sugar phosphate isomerase/epimerase
MIHRREFLCAALATGATLAATPFAAAIDPIRRTGKPHIRLSIAAYSYRDSLSPRGGAQPTMTLDDFADLAASLDLDAVEPTSYYFRDTSPEFMARFKGRCSRLGLDVSGTAVGNDFCSPDADKMKAAMNTVKTWTEHCARLGGKTVRIFAGNVDKKVASETEETARKRCVAAIQEACDHAAKYGIYLALENHGGIVATAEQMLAVIQAVKHDYFGVNLDTGNFHTADPYSDLAKIAPYAVVVQIKTEIQRAGQKKEDADYKRKLQILRDAGFRGYVALEYEAAEDPKTGVPKAVAELRKLVREG